MFHFIFYSLTAQEVDELRLGRERQARKRKAATEKKQAEAKAAEEAAKVKELEEKALRAREEKQRDELLAQNKALSERLLAMCPTSKPVQPVYAPQTVSSPHTSLSLPDPLPAPQQGHAANILQMLQGFMSSFAPPPAPPQTVAQDLSIVPLGVTPNMETPMGTEIVVLQPGAPVGIGTPLTTRMPTSAGAPASVTSETIESGPTNEEMRASTLVTRQKGPSSCPGEFGRRHPVMAKEQPIHPQTPPQKAVPSRQATGVLNACPPIHPKSLHQGPPGDGDVAPLA